MGKVLMSTRIESTAYKALRQLAVKEDRTVSNLIRIAVKELLRANDPQDQRGVEKGV